MMETAPAETWGGLTMAEWCGGTQGTAEGSSGARRQPPISPGAWGPPAASTTSTSTGNNGNGDLLPAAQLKPPLKW